VHYTNNSSIYKFSIDVGDGAVTGGGAGGDAGGGCVARCG